MAIKPNPLFDVWTPDEVAECLDGVVSDGDYSLYKTLWSLLKPRSSPEEREIPDVDSDHVLAASWTRLTTDDQIALNTLAERSNPNTGE